MPKRYCVYQADAFTRQQFTGNPAGVVTNADGLSELQMMAIARELNNSETVFILPPESADHQVRLRYFTPTTEVPICGHATIAAHYVRAIEGAAPGTILQKSNAGILPVTIEADGADFRIWMQQLPAEFSAVLSDPVLDQLCTALRIAPAMLGNGPVQIVSTGHSKVMIPLRDRAVLNGLEPDLSLLAALSREIGCNGYYTFTTANPDPGVTAHGRMFAPAIGIAEDPVTGNADGPLGAYLLHYRLSPETSPGRLTLRVVQGERLGRPGSVHVEAARQNDGRIAVRIAGEAVVVFRTEIEM